MLKHDSVLYSLHGTIIFYCMDIAYLVINLSVNGYLSCLHFGIFWNICYKHLCICFCVKVCFKFCFSYISLGVELLSPMLILCLTFWTNAKLFSITTVLFYAYYPSRSVWGFQFPTLIIISLFAYSYP